MPLDSLAFGASWLPEGKLSVSSPETIGPGGHFGATIDKTQRARADAFPRIQLESLISLLENSLFKFYFSKMKSYFLPNLLLSSDQQNLS